MTVCCNCSVAPRPALPAAARHHKRRLTPVPAAHAVQALRAEVRFNCSDRGYGSEQCQGECFTALAIEVAALAGPALPPSCACNSTRAPGMCLATRVGSQCLCVVWCEVG